MMKRRDLLKLFTFSPIGVLFALRNPYRFHQIVGGHTTVWTANPQYHRARLPDLWSPHRSLVEAMADHCMAAAKYRDTRGWTLKQWNEELIKAKCDWQQEDMIRKSHEKKRST